MKRTYERVAESDPKRTKEELTNNISCNPTNNSPNCQLMSASAKLFEQIYRSSQCELPLSMPKLVRQ